MYVLFWRASIDKILETYRCIGDHWIAFGYIIRSHGNQRTHSAFGRIEMYSNVIRYRLFTLSFIDDVMSLWVWMSTCVCRRVRVEVMTLHNDVVTTVLTGPGLNGPAVYPVPPTDTHIEAGHHAVRGAHAQLRHTSVGGCAGLGGTPGRKHEGWRWGFRVHGLLVGWGRGFHSLKQSRQKCTEHANHWQTDGSTLYLWRTCTTVLFRDHVSLFILIASPLKSVFTSRQ